MMKTKAYENFSRTCKYKNCRSVSEIYSIVQIRLFKFHKKNREEKCADITLTKAAINLSHSNYKSD